MPNIAILNECNLRCPYCFADDMIENQKVDVAHESQIMSVDDFIEILQFVDKSPVVDRIGIIGGEPTLHPDIKQILSETEIFCKKRGCTSTIFTNGIHLDNIIPFISKDLFHVLVNLNSPAITGQENYNKIIDNLSLVYNVFGWQDKVSIGLNIFYEMDDYSFFYDVIKKFNVKRVRTSIVAPTYKDHKNDKEAYYKKMKNKALDVYRNIYEAGAIVDLDCNRIPLCYFNPAEVKLLKEYTNNMYTHFFCAPIIDINPKFEAVRCFGVYDPVKIYDFQSLDAIHRYFSIKKDCKIIEDNRVQKCTHCKNFEAMACYGGCLSFASKKV